jgi:hypothetical protein
VVDWKSSGTQLISGIVGSSLFLFGVTTFYTDYLQRPQLFIDTGTDFISHTPSDVFNMSTKETELKYTILARVSNHGNTPAKEVLVTCFLDDNDNYIVSGKPLAESEEEFNETREEPKLVAWEMSRLATDSTFTIRVNVTQTFQPNHVPTDLLSSNLDNGTIQRYAPSFKISAAADQGTQVKIQGETPDVLSVQLANIRGGISNFAPLIVLSAISVTIIYIPRISDTVRNRRIGNERVKMISEVHDEIKMVHDTLLRDMNSKRIFPYKPWYSASPDIKHQIFDNYDDLNKINIFYEELEIRDSLLAANSDVFMVNNEELFHLSDEILRKIPWSRYLVIHFSVPMAMTIFSALAVLGGEILLYLLIPIYLSPQIFQLISDYLIVEVTRYSIMTVIGTLIALPLLRKILNIKSVFPKLEYTISFSRSTSNQFRLTSYMKIRLILIALVMGTQASLFIFLATYSLSYYLDDPYITLIGVVLQILTTFLYVREAAGKLKKSIISK